MSTPLDRPTTAPSCAPVRLAAVLAASAAAAALWWITGPVAGVDVAVDTGGGATPVGPVAVVVAALLAGLAGWGLLAVLERTTRRPRAAWTATATVVLAGSLAGPLTAGASGPAGTLTLVGLHVVTGAVLIALLPRRSPC